MSDGAALRAAIRSAPTAATARLVYADWLDENDQPGGDLIRLLVELPLWHAAPQVAEWFHQRHGWPMPERFIASEWLQEVLDPRWWPDPQRLCACARAVAERMLPVAEHGLPPGDSFRIVLAEVAGSSDQSVRDRAGLISRTAATVATICLSWIGDSAGDAANQECCEQIHVVAWTWLNLPPLLPAPVPPALQVVPVDPEPPVPPAPERRSWWRRLFGG